MTLQVARVMKVAGTHPIDIGGFEHIVKDKDIISDRLAPAAVIKYVLPMKAANLDLRKTEEAAGYTNHETNVSGEKIKTHELQIVDSVESIEYTNNINSTNNTDHDSKDSRNNNDHSSKLGKRKKEEMNTKRIRCTVMQKIDLVLEGKETSMDIVAKKYGISRSAVHEWNKNLDALWEEAKLNPNATRTDVSGSCRNNDRSIRTSRYRNKSDDDESINLSSKKKRNLPQKQNHITFTIIEKISIVLEAKAAKDFSGTAKKYNIGRKRLWYWRKQLPLLQEKAERIQQSKSSYYQPKRVTLSRIYDLDDDSNVDGSIYDPDSSDQEDGNIHDVSNGIVSHKNEVSINCSNVVIENDDTSIETADLQTKPLACMIPYNDDVSSSDQVDERGKLHQRNNIFSVEESKKHESQIVESSEAIENDITIFERIDDHREHDMSNSIMNHEAEISKTGINPEVENNMHSNDSIEAKALLTEPIAFLISCNAYVSSKAGINAEVENDIHSNDSIETVVLQTESETIPITRNGDMRPAETGMNVELENDTNSIDGIETVFLLTEPETGLILCNDDEPSETDMNAEVESRNDSIETVRFQPQHASDLTPCNDDLSSSDQDDKGSSNKNDRRLKAKMGGYDRSKFLMIKKGMYGSLSLFTIVQKIDIVLEGKETSMSAVAKKYGITPSTVGGWNKNLDALWEKAKFHPNATSLAGFGCPVRHARPVTTQEKIDIVLEAQAEKGINAATAKKYNINTHRLQRWIKRLPFLQKILEKEQKQKEMAIHEAKRLDIVEHATNSICNPDENDDGDHSENVSNRVHDVSRSQPEDNYDDGYSDDSSDESYHDDENDGDADSDDDENDSDADSDDSSNCMDDVSSSYTVDFIDEESDKESECVENILSKYADDNGDDSDDETYHVDENSESSDDSLVEMCGVPEVYYIKKGKDGNVSDCSDSVHSDVEENAKDGSLDGVAEEDSNSELPIGQMKENANYGSHIRVNEENRKSLSCGIDMIVNLKNPEIIQKMTDWITQKINNGVAVSTYQICEKLLECEPSLDNGDEKKTKKRLYAFLERSNIVYSKKGVTLYMSRID